MASINQKGFPAFSEPQLESLELILNTPGVVDITADAIADTLETAPPADLARIQVAVSTAPAVQAAIASDKPGFVSALLAAEQASPAAANAAELLNALPQTLPPGFSKLANPITKYNYGCTVSAGEITIGRTGLYLLYASARIDDSATTGTQYGIGVHTLIGDGDWFYWTGKSASLRDTFPYVRVAKYDAGDVLKMFTFSDGAAVMTSCSYGVVMLYPL